MRGLVVQVDPSVRPDSLRDVECLRPTAMTESAGCAYFSLAGYGDAARARTGELRIPLFVLDRAGIPQPVNEAADALHPIGVRGAGRLAHTPYCSRSSTLRTFPETVIGKDSRIRSRLGIL